jgi:GAF domain-containing protein
MRGAPSKDVQLARAMGELAVRLREQPDRERTLAAILAGAGDTVPGAEVAGVTLVRDGEVASDARTDELARRVDSIQAELHEGPCLTTLRDTETVRVDDLTHDERWPRFGARAVELGVRSVLSFRMFVRRGSLGSLNLYSQHPGAFGDDSYTIGSLFAQHAAVAYAGAEAEHQLGRALSSRDLIGQAKGILMQRDNLTAQQAFDVLVEASQHVNLKVVEVARWLVEEVEKNVGGPSG